MHKIVYTSIKTITVLLLFITPFAQAHDSVQELAYCEAEPDGRNPDCYNISDRRRINSNLRDMLDDGWQLTSVVANSTTGLNYFYFTRLRE
ncbi:hypothetical protein H0A36_22500 [Endozoicomonas sp. SM1973]|uniref:DUF4177 domain-containing protein n=1 Tax=Spartinivicinus marinus TaxID=2994442 RepID=A0A853IAG5_9GAMM|nr:hypothetical protein [Spartinivicinus marinus]MCX4029057.1 hypothetical protein [Spartinivicinus marinus]NYZ68792.1 hypothetical protein [Spartinivicinus marinus]